MEGSAGGSAQIYFGQTVFKPQILPERFWEGRPEALPKIGSDFLASDRHKTFSTHTKTEGTAGGSA